MSHRYRHLDFDERRRIDRFLAQRVPIDEIARRLGRHRSTLYRELKRNRFVDPGYSELDGYWHTIAHRRAAARRKRRMKLLRHRDLLQAVAAKLGAGWSPEQIAGRLRRDQSPVRICHETIYRFVYSRETLAEGLYRHLPEQRRRRRPRHARSRRGLYLPDSKSIAFRPDHITERREFGHWEGDLLMFRKEHGKANVLSLVERTTRFTVLVRNNDRQSRPIFEAMILMFSRLPGEASRSFTFDRGTEFSAWQTLEHELGAESWFCDPRSPWQKGTVENTNRRLRRYLPSFINPMDVSPRQLKRLAGEFNAIPRKCLGYATPEEEFRARLLALG